MMDIYFEKRELRKKIKLLKQDYSLEQKKEMSLSIWKQLEATDVFREANIIMAYWSMDDEVFTHDFIQKWYAEKKIILPVVRGTELELKEFKGIREMVAGEKYGIPEPIGPTFQQPESIALIVVPGVAFDNNGNRMGRGKAYYDKLLRSSRAYKVGVCFPFQLRAHIPFDELDVRMDKIIISS